MKPENKKQEKVKEELLSLYGNTLNLSGIVLAPSDDVFYDGRVYFNLIDSPNGDFGRHVLYYSIVPSGKVLLFNNYLTT